MPPSARRSQRGSLPKEAEERPRGRVWLTLVRGGVERALWGAGFAWATLCGGEDRRAQQGEPRHGHGHGGGAAPAGRPTAAFPNPRSSHGASLWMGRSLSVTSASRLQRPDCTHLAGDGVAGAAEAVSLQTLGTERWRSRPRPQTRVHSTEVGAGRGCCPTDTDTWLELWWPGPTAEPSGEHASPRPDRAPRVSFPVRGLWTLTMWPPVSAFLHLSPAATLKSINEEWTCSPAGAAQRTSIGPWTVPL